MQSYFLGNPVLNPYSDKKILSQNFAPAELTDTESETVGLNQEPKTEEMEETDVSQLLQLLKTKNNREICEFLNISPNQLYDELLKLKNKGTQYIRKYYSDGFIKYKDSKNNLKFNNLISTVERLNKAIEDDETLGKGFMIGHSYFCTENEIDDSWLNSVVRYELVPLINEYWFDEPEKIRDWERALYGSVQ